jgi:hypothetical protein
LLGFELSVFGFELLKVFFPTLAGAALIVADTGEVGGLLGVL